MQLILILMFIFIVVSAQVLNAIGRRLGPGATRTRFAILDLLHLSRVSPIPCSHCFGYGEIETFKGMARCPDLVRCPPGLEVDVHVAHHANAAARIVADVLQVHIG